MNEHACRIFDPDEVDAVGSGTREHGGKAYRVIFGKPKGDGESVEQAYRYPISEWSESGGPGSLQRSWRDPIRASHESSIGIGDRAQVLGCGP